MIVLNSAWQLAGVATPTTLTVQNVGTPRIAYTFAASLPAVDDIVLDSDEHFTFIPGSSALSYANLETEGLSMYVRALGPISGDLAVSSYAAP